MQPIYCDKYTTVLLTQVCFETLVLDDFIYDITKWPRRAELLVAGGFNVYLTELEVNTHDEDINTALAKAWMEYMISYFLPRSKPLLMDSKHVACYLGYGRCDPVPTTSWIQTAVSSRMCRPGTRTTTQTIT